MCARTSAPRYWCQRTTHLVKMLQARATALQQVQPTGLFAKLQVTALVRLVIDLVDEDERGLPKSQFCLH